MFDLALVSSLVGGVSTVIQKLKSEKIVSHEGIIIYQERCEAEYRIDLNIGDHKYRSTAFRNFLRSKTLKKITFEAIDATGTGLNNENLIDMGLMEWNENKLTIDFPKIFSEVKSSLVIIIFKTKISPDIVDKLIHREISKVCTIKDGKIIANFALVLDYANMWHSNFTSFAVRNIDFKINHVLPQYEMNFLMSDDLRNKIEKADTVALKKENARKYLLELQRTILEIQSPEFLNEIHKLIVIDPPSNGRVDTITPSLRVYHLPCSKIGLTIPDLFVLKIYVNIEDRETAIHGTITFDLESFRNLLRKKFKKFRDKNKKLKF